MPAATDEQVPKPLTYTLMYHGLWCAMFLLSAFGLSGLFFASGVGFLRALLAPWPLLALALAAGLGLFATYAVRIQVLLGEFDKLEAFRWSEASSWAVLICAPVIWLLWVFAEPLVQQLANGGHPWAPPEAIVSATVKVEVVVWWLSHLLSVRGLSRGRKQYFPAAAHGSPPAEATQVAAGVNPPPDDSSRASGGSNGRGTVTLAPAGDPHS